MIVENAGELRERFHFGYRGYWRCMECGVRIPRTANLAAHTCAGRRELHAQMLDVPTYTCRECGWTIEEPKLPFQHTCPLRGSDLKSQISAECGEAHCSRSVADGEVNA